MRREEILVFLDDTHYCSGAQIAAELGVSRAAVAKAVNALRNDGYEIDAVPNRGYRLHRLPEQLDEPAIRRLLGTHSWHDRVHVFSQIDSTNLELKRMASFAPHGTVAVAEEQSAGRGRMGRQFLSRPGVGIYLSVLLRLDCPPQSLMSLTAQAAVAVRRAIAQECGLQTQIKWVNDLQSGGRKLCGILTELSIEAESGRVSYAIVGIGINCNQQLADFPPELREIAGSIRAQSGQAVDRNRLTAALIRALSALPELDWEQEYRENCLTLGKDILIMQAGRTQEAFALDIGQHAELLVRYPDGSTGIINSGEVSVRPKL